MSATAPSTVQSPTAAELADLLRRQQAHRPVVRATTAAQRKDKLGRLLAYLDRADRREALVNALHADLRKHEVETLTSELGLIYSHVNHIRAHLGRWMEPRRVATPLSLLGTRSYIVHEPKGSALIIAPWNYPLNLAVIPLVYAVAAGCTVVLKPSELSPATTAFIAELVAAVFPEEEAAVVTGDGETAAALTALPFDHIFFTGSPAIGKKVMAAAARNLTSVTLELGGKSPCVVDGSRNIETSAANLAWGKFFNGGQTCIAPDYLLVHESVADRYVAALGRAITDFYGEDPRASADLARIVHDRHFDRLVDLLDDARRRGATIVHGGRHDRAVRYLEPTIVTGVTTEMKLLREEIFGPVLPVVTYRELDEAIDFINRLPKALSFYVQSDRRATVRRLLAGSSSGGVVVNDFLIGGSNPALPFGGVNNSGIGKGFGHHGFLDFTNERSVIERRFGDLSIAYPPYTERITELARRLYKRL